MLKTHLTFTLALVAAIAVAGCALTPDQLKAIGESKSATTVCHNAKGYGVESTTVVTNAGAGNGVLIQVAPDCGSGNVRPVLPPVTQ